MNHLVDRFNSRGMLLVILCVLSFVALKLSPLTADILLSNTRGLVTYIDLKYSHLHQRPFESCPNIASAYNEHQEKVKNRLSADTSCPEMIRIYNLLKYYNQEFLNLYLSPCEGNWSYGFDYGGYQYFFAYIAPQIWLIEQFGVTEIYISLFFIIGSWFGLVSLFFIARRLTNSVVIGLLTIVVLYCTLIFFEISGNNRLYLLNTFPLIYFGQLFASSNWPSKKLSIDKYLPYFQEIAIALLFGLYSIISLFSYPLSSRIDAILLVGTILLVGLFRRNRKIFARGICVLAVLLVFQWPYQHHSFNLLNPISPSHTANSEEFKFVNLVTYLFERPNHYGMPNGDFAYFWVFDWDYYLAPNYERRYFLNSWVHNNKPLPFFHSYSAWGNKFFLDVLKNHPGELIEAWWKRFFAQIYFHEKLSFGIYGTYPEVGMFLFWLSLLLGSFVIMSGSKLGLVWPPVIITSWHLFGLHTFLALIHTHTTYSQRGIFLLWCFLPSFVVLAMQQIINWKYLLSREVIRKSYFQGTRLFYVFTVFVIFAMLSVPYFIREAKKEIHAFQVWYAVHVGAGSFTAYRSPDSIVEEVKTIEELGHNDAGTVNMYAAQAMLAFYQRANFYRNVVPDKSMLNKDIERAKSLILPLYHQALVEAPDNMWFPIYALYFEDPKWAEIYKRTLDKFPDHPYATMMSWYLSNEPTFSAEERHRYQQIYEMSVERLLSESSKFRPGYKRLPQLFSKSDILLNKEEGGLKVIIPPNGNVELEAIDILHSNQIKVGLYLKVLDGQLTGELFGDGGRIGEAVPMKKEDAVNYRLFSRIIPDSGVSKIKVVLRSGEKGSTFIVRDFYPMIENPRFFRSSSF